MYCLHQTFERFDFDLSEIYLTGKLTVWQLGPGRCGVCRNDANRQYCHQHRVRHSLLLLLILRTEKEMRTSFNDGGAWRIQLFFSQKLTTSNFIESESMFTENTTVALQVLQYLYDDLIGLSSKR